MECYIFVRLNKDYSLSTHKLSEYLLSFNGLPTIDTGALERIRALELDRALFELLVMCDFGEGCFSL